MNRTFVVLVLDIADNLLDDVFNRNQSIGAAILVDDQREMNACRLHFRQQIDGRHRWRPIEQRARDADRLQRNAEIDRLEIEARNLRLGLALGWLRRHRRLLGHERDQVADMNHAGRIVERVVINHETRMRRALEYLHQFAE